MSFTDLLPGMGDQNPIDAAAGASLGRLRLATLLLAALVALSFPALRYYFGITSIKQALHVEANQLADELSRRASARPELWLYERNSIDTLLAGALLRHHVAAARVLDAKGNELGAIGRWATGTTESAAILDSGLEVAHVSLQASTQELSQSLVWVVALGALFGALLYFVVNRFAVASVSRSLHQLQAARDDAERAGRARAAFLATMSHEIRTPMNGVIGMTSLLLETPLTAQQRHFVETIRASGDGLLTVINDILEFSKVESGKLTLEPHVFSPEALVDEVLAVLGTTAESKRIDLVSRVAPGTPAFVRADSTRLRQILMNLIGNAIKFTQTGDVLVTVEAPSAGRLCCRVRDTGIGMSADEIGRVFAPFVQADASTTRRFGGTGLGLAISRRIAQAMGGDIAVESTPDQGSTFSVEVDVEPVTERPDELQQAATVRLAGQRVLIVDDNPTNREVLSAYCRVWSMEVVTASSGPEALEVIKAPAPFAVAIIDYHMPAMDGVTLARHFQLQRPGMARVLASSIVDANLPPGLFAAHTAKPLRRTQLQEMLIKALARQPDLPSDAPPNRPHSPSRSLRILVVEDNPINALVVRSMLERCNQASDLAGNGVEAIDAIKRQPYDLVFMDMLMPDMDGLQATRAIRALTPAKQPYIVALTANVMVEDQEACIAAGMDEFLGKPVKLEDLESCLDRVASRLAEAR